MFRLARSAALTLLFGLAAAPALAAYPSPTFQTETLEANPTWLGCPAGTAPLGGGASPLTCVSTLPASLMPAPTLSALGGVEAFAAVAHQWPSYLDTSGIWHLAQPNVGDVSGWGVGLAALLSQPPNAAGGLVGYGGAMGNAAGHASLDLPLAGGTMSGLLTTLAPASGGAGFNLPPGAAPTAPNDGDLWITSTGVYARIGGATVGPLTGAMTFYVRTVPVAAVISQASPAVVTATSHGLQVNDPVVFATSPGGVLPSGITLGQVYYVIAPGYTPNAFEISNSVGGAAINTASAGIGTFYFQTGNDNNKGLAQTRAGAFLTIKAAVNAAAAVGRNNPNSYGITIQLAAGNPSRYNLSEIDFNNAYTATTNIVGDCTTPNNTQLLFDAANYGAGFKAQHNGVLGLVDCMTINGNGWTSYGVWSGATNPYSAAIYAYLGGTINVGYKLFINNFYYGLRAELGGSIYAANNGVVSVTISQCGDVGIHAFDGGHIEARYANVSFCADTSQSLGIGILAEAGGSVVANHSLSSYNANDGIAVLNGGSMWAQNSNGSHNGKYGFHAFGGGNIDASNSVASYNTSSNYEADMNGWIEAFGSEADHSASGDGYRANGGTIDGNTATANYNAGTGAYAFNAYNHGLIYGTVNTGAGNSNNTCNATTATYGTCNAIH